MNVAKHDINCCKSRGRCSDERWKQTQECANHQRRSQRGCRWLQSTGAHPLNWPKAESTQRSPSMTVCQGGAGWVSVRAITALQLRNVGQPAWGEGANGSKSLTSSLQSHSHTLSPVFRCLVPPNPPVHFQWATATLPPSSKLQTPYSLARSLPPLKAA